MDQFNLGILMKNALKLKSIAANFIILATLSAPFCVNAENENIQSFRTAKKILETKVYFDHRETLYCGASFDIKNELLHQKVLNLKNIQTVLTELSGNT